MRLGLGLGLGYHRQAATEDDHLPATKYLFIDGGCLRAAGQQILNSFPDGPPAVSINLRHIASGFDRAFYYDAISAQDHSEQVATYQARVEPEYEHYDRIREIDGFHVSLGEIKGKGGRRRQKKVDVQLAVDMLTHSFRKNMQSVTLFAGDDDFIPLIEALVREGMKITVWHPPQASRELIAAADNHRLFDLKTSHQSFTRDGVSPAFYIGTTGGNHPPPAGVWRWVNDEVEGVASFDDQDLSVWAKIDDTWSFTGFRCKGASLSEACFVYEAISGLNIAMQTASPR